MSNPWDNDPIASGGGGNPWDADPIAGAPQTTASGVMDAITRGLAPYAGGAALGAAAGAPFAGVGAIPGAAMGAGAVGLEELGSALYNPIARATGLRELPPASEVVGKGLDYLGFKRPDTATERMAEAASGGAATAATGSGVAKQIAEKAAPGLGRMIARQFAEAPALQTASGAAAGTGQQATAEAGGGPVAQTLAAVVAGGLPIGAKVAVTKGVRGAGVTPAANEAMDAGYVLPPQMASDKPGVISDLLSAWGGKIKTQQSASVRNQPVTNRLAAEGLGLPGETDLSEGDATKGVRSEAGDAYKALAEAKPQMVADQEFIDDATAILGPNTQLAKFFPKTSDHPEIAALVDDLSNLRDVPTDVLVEKVKALRADAQGNQNGPYDPGKRALGRAQKQGADAIEGLVERNLAGKAVSVVPPLAEPNSIPAPREEAIPGLISQAQEKPLASGPIGDRRRTPTVEVPRIGGAQNFLKWVQSNGGIRDSDGTVAAMYQANGKAPPVGLISNSGTPLDVLARRAQEAGYLKGEYDPNKPEELMPDDVLRLLSEQIDGKRSYKQGDAVAVEARTTAEDTNRQLRDLAGQYGIDYRGMSPEQFHETLSRHADMLDRADKLGVKLHGNENPAEVAALVHEREGMAHEPGGASADQIESDLDARTGAGLPEHYDVLDWLHDGPFASGEDSAQSAAARGASTSDRGPSGAGTDEAGRAGNGSLSGGSPADEASRLVTSYRQARQLIAKSYDVDKATNSATGDVSARLLGRLLARGKPLSGELKTVAKAAQSFPKAFQDKAAVGGDQPFSAVDAGTALLLAAHLKPDIAGALLARPVARSLMFSKAYQRAMRGPEARGAAVAPYTANVLAERAKKGKR